MTNRCVANDVLGYKPVVQSGRVRIMDEVELQSFRPFEHGFIGLDIDEWDAFPFPRAVTRSGSRATYTLPSVGVEAAERAIGPSIYLLLLFDRARIWW